jgi:hypothetical protein
LPVLRGVDYERDGTAEMLICNYALGGDFDDELLAPGEQALEEIDETIDTGLTAESGAYFAEGKSVIGEILPEPK